MEDDVRLAQEWAGFIRSRQYDVYLTTRGSEALALYRDKSIDLCIVDLFVREDGAFVDDGGVSFLAKLRLEPRFVAHPIPLLGVSGAPKQGGLDPEQHLRLMGVHGFLAKPFTSLELFDRVVRLLHEFRVES